MALASINIMRVPLQVLGNWFFKNLVDSGIWLCKRKNLIQTFLIKFLFIFNHRKSNYSFTRVKRDKQFSREKGVCQHQ
jgi:hypothetical protein